MGSCCLHLISKTEVLKFHIASASPQSLIKVQILGPNSKILIQPVYGGTWEFVFFTFSKVMLMLIVLVLRPRFKNRWSREMKEFNS